MEIAKARNLSLRYQISDDFLLSSLSFSIERGEKVLLLGPSGTGKSSLLMTLRGIIPNLFPAEVTGELSLFGKSLSPENLNFISSKTGFLLQNYESQFFGRTVREEFHLSGINLKKLTPVEMEVLEALKITPLLDRSVRTLSSGEKQRVLLTIFVLKNKSLLLLDEPFSNIDRETEKILAEFLNFRVSQGTGILLSMNHLNKFLKTHRVFVLAGSHDFFSETETTFKRKARFYEELGIRVNGVPRLGTISSISGLPPILSARNLEIKLEGKEILKDVDLDLYPGTITVLVGENGVGKTILAKILSGFLRPQRGDVFCCGKKLKGPSGKKVQIVFQNPLNQLFLEKTIEELRWANSSDSEEINEILTLFNLERKKEAPVRALSWGEKQRLAIGAALLKDPRVLILDEPTHGQDLRGLKSLQKALLKLKNTGKAILLITHDEEIAYSFGDKVYELVKGQIYEKNF